MERTLAYVLTVSPEFTTLVLAAGAWTFSLPNGGGTVASSTATSVTVNWGSVPGTYFVRATDGIIVLLRSVVVKVTWHWLATIW